MCCIARRQAQALGFRLVDGRTGSDVVVGRLATTASGEPYTVLEADAATSANPTAVVSFRGRILAIPISIRQIHGQKVGIIGL